MKKLLACLLAVMLCLGATSLAEESKWIDFTPFLTPVIYESIEEVTESNVAATVACACMVLDYALAEPTAYTLGGGDLYAVMDYSGKTLAIAPVMSNEDGVGCALLLYDFTAKAASVRFLEYTAASTIEAMKAEASVAYELSNMEVAAAAEALLDAILGEE